MKPIEERANAAWLDYEYKEGELYSTCFIDGFSAGAQSEREELTRWRDPKKELPELLTPVLGKQSDAKKTYYKVVYRREYDDDIGYYWTDNGCRSLYIDGWRPIYENKQDALCIFTS